MNKLFLAAIFIFCLFSSQGAFSQPKDTTELSQECIKVLTPALKDFGMTLADLNDETSASKFIKYSKKTKAWESIRSACQPKLLEGCDCINECGCDYVACYPKMPNDRTYVNCKHCGFFTCCRWYCCDSCEDDDD